MRAQDKELVTLYWKLQKLVHTNPKMCVYLNDVKQKLRRRAVPPVELCDMGRMLMHH